MTREFTWEASPLSADDQRLVDAYVRVGRSLDDLAYTDEFDRLYRIVVGDQLSPDKHEIYKRLLTLRKMARLPRLYS